MTRFHALDSCGIHVSAPGKRLYLTDIDNAVIDRHIVDVHADELSQRQIPCQVCPTSLSG